MTAARRSPAEEFETRCSSPNAPSNGEGDHRQWWYCGAATWVGLHLVEAPTARSALAQYRRDLIEAERLAGRTRRDAEAVVRVAGLRIVEGPLDTAAAREREFGWALAWAVCDKHTLRIDPASPATLDDAAPWLSDREVEVLRANVERVFPQLAKQDESPV